jgi:hypothetical protein
MGVVWDLFGRQARVASGASGGVDGAWFEREECGRWSGCGGCGGGCTGAGRGCLVTLGAACALRFRRSKGPATVSGGRAQDLSWRRLAVFGHSHNALCASLGGQEGPCGARDRFSAGLIPLSRGSASPAWVTPGNGRFWQDPRKQAEVRQTQLPGYHDCYHDLVTA